MNKMSNMIDCKIIIKKNLEKYNRNILKIYKNIKKLLINYKINHNYY